MENSSQNIRADLRIFFYSVMPSPGLHPCIGKADPTAILLTTVFYCRRFYYTYSLAGVVLSAAEAIAYEDLDISGGPNVSPPTCSLVPITSDMSEKNRGHFGIFTNDVFLSI